MSKTDISFAPNFIIPLLADQLCSNIVILRIIIAIATDFCVLLIENMIFQAALKQVS